VARQKPATVRFYFDEDILRLAHTICRLRNDCTYPGDPGDFIHGRLRPPSPVAKSTKDPIWVPLVTQRGWLIISRDLRIRENIAERRIVRDAGARMVALSGEDAGNTWLQLGLLMKWWTRIEALLDEPGPFIYLAQRSRLVPLSLDDV
jgi:hypothetical protein